MIPEEGSKRLLSPSAPPVRPCVHPAVQIWNRTVPASPQHPQRPRSTQLALRELLSPVPHPMAGGCPGLPTSPTPSPTRVQDERDDAQLHVAGGAVELPQELAAMVQSEEEEEDDDDDGAGAFAFLTKLREVDLPALRDRALGTVDEVKEKCALM